MSEGMTGEAARIGEMLRLGRGAKEMGEAMKSSGRFALVKERAASPVSLLPKGRVDPPALPEFEGIAAMSP